MKAELSQQFSDGTTPTTSHTRRLVIGLIGLVLIGSAAFSSTPAQATDLATSGAAPTVPVADCIDPAQRATKWREGADTDEVSPAVRAEVAKVVASATSSSSTRSAALPARIHVQVVIHVIHGRHKGERRINRRKARRMFQILKGGYAGAQSLTMADTGVVFQFRKITVTRNEKWFHAVPFSPADRQMKRRLHRGSAQTLNIYVNRPRSGTQLLLGFSLFPWQRAGHRTLDGVTVSDIALPGGRARGYNLGDTVIHETGHWLGLLHTFEGYDCTGRGDGVADTPAEAQPSFRCSVRNTCDTPVFTNPLDPEGMKIDLPDPIHNFMDYSYDSCMYEFTPGQRDRMFALFMHYRYGRR